MKIENHLFKISFVLTILTIFLYTCHTYSFVKFMTSVLGKLFVVGLILFYTYIDKIYGILVCLIVIVFYQSDTTRWLEEGFFSYIQTPTKPPEEKPTPDTSYINVVNLEDNLTERRKKEFQRRHCNIETGKLTFKNIPVKKDMSAIVFSEINYGEGGICNVCDDNCDYTILDKAT